MEYFNYERELIVSLMCGGATPNAIEVIDKMRPEMMCGAFARMFEAVQYLYAKGSPFTPLEVAEKSGEDMMDLINMCKASAGSPSNVRGYAKRVRQGYYLRKAERDLQEALDEIRSCDHESRVGEIAEKIESIVAGMVIETDTKQPRVAADILEQYIDIVADRINGCENERRLKVGIDELDRKTGGFNLTDLILVAGAPGMGKTELMVKMITGASNSDRGPLIFSMEMDEYQIIERAIAIESDMPISVVRAPQGMGDFDAAKFHQGISIVKDKKFFVLDQSGLTVGEICAQARQHKTRHPKTNLICIDYVGLIEIAKGDRHDIALGEVSRKLKGLAKELKTPVMLLSQITSKVVESRADKRPMNSDLKDSSRLVDDADWIVFPYRDEVYNEDSHLKGLAEIIIGKARHGEKGKVHMGWRKGHFTNLTDLELHDAQQIRPPQDNGYKGF